MERYSKIEPYLEYKDGKEWKNAKSVLQEYMQRNLVKIQEIEVSAKTPDQITKYLKEFNSQARKKHYQFIAQNEPKALKKMGITHPEAIDFIKKNGFQAHKKPQFISSATEFKLYATVHRKPLYLGGNNAQDNLCQFPKSLAMIKDRVEGKQIGENKNPETIITLVPTEKRCGDRRIVIPNLPNVSLKVR